MLSPNTQYLVGTTVTFPSDLSLERVGSTFNAYVDEYGHSTMGIPRKLAGSVTLPVGEADHAGAGGKWKWDFCCLRRRITAMLTRSQL